MEKMATSQTVDILDMNLRSVDTASAISGLRKYLELTETQMEKVYRSELEAHASGTPKNADEEDRDLHWQIGNLLEQEFEQDLIPAMRYSFIVLVHIVFESHLRRFCADVQNERKIALSLSDIAGKSPVERSSTYLTKVLGLPVGNLQEWQHLRTVQKIRDCIVHAYGHVKESRD